MVIIKRDNQRKSGATQILDKTQLEAVDLLRTFIVWRFSVNGLIEAYKIVNDRCCVLPAKSGEGDHHRILGRAIHQLFVPLLPPLGHGCRVRHLLSDRAEEAVVLISGKLI
jgi:hypothetical protein